MTEPLARLDAVRDGAHVVLTLSGEIDNSNAAELEARMVDEAGTAGRVVVDLGAVTYIDSQGLRLLVEFSRRLSATGTPFTVVAPPGGFAAEVLEITSMGALLNVVGELGDPGPGASPPP
jgi:stage II sporulation protein AA (anti-sigma F factor antagonist)